MGPDREAALGGDNQVFRIWMERLGDQPFADFGAIGIRRIDEVNAQVDGAAQDAAAFLGVGWLAPNAFARNAHGAIAEPVDRKIVADSKGAAGRGRDGFHADGMIRRRGRFRAIPECYIGVLAFPGLVAQLVRALP